MIIVFDLSDAQSLTLLETLWIAEVQRVAPRAAIVLAGDVSRGGVEAGGTEQCASLAAHLGTKKRPCSFVTFSFDGPMRASSVFAQACRILHALHRRQGRRGIVGALKTWGRGIKARISSLSPTSRRHRTARSASPSESHQFHDEPEDVVTNDPAPARRSFRVVVPAATLDTARPQPHVGSPPDTRLLDGPVARSFMLLGETGELLDSTTMEPIHAAPVEIFRTFMLHHQGAHHAVQQHRPAVVRSSSPPISDVFPNVGTITRREHMLDAIRHIEQTMGHGLFSTTDATDCAVCALICSSHQ